MPDPVSLQSGEGVIRCPAIRSLIKEEKLTHDRLQTAAVADLVKVLSGGADRGLAPSEAGSLANVAALFAIFNHAVPQGNGGGSQGFFGFVRKLFGRGRDLRDAGLAATGAASDRRFDLHLRQSRGDHPGTVDFFKDDDGGAFQEGHFRAVMNQVSDGRTLTIEGIARMIIMANARGGSAVDLAKSAGEWALMVCVLRLDAESNAIPVAHLEAMYSQADSSQLLRGSRTATAHDWIEVTAKIAGAIAKEKAHQTVVGELHRAFGAFNDLSGEKLCPCEPCNPAIWERDGAAASVPL